MKTHYLRRYPTVTDGRRSGFLCRHVGRTETGLYWHNALNLEACKGELLHLGWGLSIRRLQFRIVGH